MKRSQLRLVTYDVQQDVIKFFQGNLQTHQTEEKGVITVNIEQALLEQIRFLTSEQQQEVLDFAAFLRQKAPIISNKKRVPGLHKGNAYWMADDFDGPLPDEFWLGEA